MSSIVLDSSVVLALLLNERGGDQLPSVTRYLISAVNLCEVHARLLRLESPTAELRHTISSIVKPVPFTAAHAVAAAVLEKQTRQLSLSLGDRACLALGIELGADVYTADRAWTTLDLPCRIHLIR